MARDAIVRFALLLSAWLLLAPPDVYRDGASRMDDDQPLWTWKRLGSFPDAPACRRFRDERVVAAQGDAEWAFWSKAQCFIAERADGGRLTPDEKP